MQILGRTQFRYSRGMNHPHYSVNLTKAGVQLARVAALGPDTFTHLSRRFEFDPSTFWQKIVPLAECGVLVDGDST